MEDHFAILKVGPALTFALREAVFALAASEDELVPPEARSNIVQALEAAMLRHPVHWERYYHSDEAERRRKRRFSLSDRVRYYWTEPQVQAALTRLLENLSARPLPLTLISQYLPEQYEKVRSGEVKNHPREFLLARVRKRLDDYAFACNAA